MLFNSFEFLVFLVIVFCVYWTLSQNLKYQNLLLLLSSYFFYGWWDWRFLGLILFSSVVDFLVGWKVYNCNKERGRKNWLLVSLIANLGLLSLFKYYNFFADSFVKAVTKLGWQPNDLTLDIILPVGISFYTFQTLSYTIDIYRGTLKPTSNVINFFTYIAFFPQLVAGPIERAADLLPQIEKKRFFQKDWFNAGLIQISVGLFRKIVIADTLAIYVDTTFANPDIYNSSTYVISILLYAFQIYFDFSGYSDIAIGTAKLFGFKFKQNFDMPYFSTSLTMFWRKWHKSLSSWLKDYLYISMGGNRKGIKITYRNLMITMLLGGLWHGSHWNFIIWGGIHGTVLSVEKFLDSKQLFMRLRSFKFFGFLATFIIVLFAWIFFRAPNFFTAKSIILRIADLDFSYPFIGDSGIFFNSLFVLFLGISFDLYLYKKRMPLEKYGASMKMFEVLTFTCIVVILITLFYSSSNNFIYFQF